MVEHRLDNVRCNANARHAAGGGAAQIVKRPALRRLGDRVGFQPVDDRSIYCVFGASKPETGVAPVVVETKASFLSPPNTRSRLFSAAGALTFSHGDVAMMPRSTAQLQRRRNTASVR